MRLFVFLCFLLLMSSCTASTDKEQEKNLLTEKSIVRIGSYDLTESLNSGFSFKDYKQSALSKIDSEYLYNNEDVIDVPYKDDVEIEVHYLPIKLAEEEIFTRHSYFEVATESDNGYISKVTLMKSKTIPWQIKEDKSIALYSPWVDGKKSKLTLYIETESGEKYKKEWTFNVIEDTKNQ